MAKITELDQTEEPSFLDYVCAILGYMKYLIWILTKPLVLFQELFQSRTQSNACSRVELFQKKQVNGPSSQVEAEKLIVVRRDTNWIDNYRRDNEWRHDSVNTANSSAGCIVGVMKLMGRQFKQVYTGLGFSPQTPSPKTTFGHVTVINLLQAPNRAAYTPDSNYEQLMAKLTWLQDNGDFDEFDKCTSSLLHYYGDKNPDITVAVLIEQSRSMLYRSQLARAKFLARTSLELATSTTCPGIYIARACLVLSACYRQKGKLGKAKIFLDKAWQNLVNIDHYEDWCRYYDAYGSYLNGISDVVTQPGERVLENAKECFFKQIQAAESGRTIRNQKFSALLKMARTLLDANTIFGQQREIPANDVARAGEYLDTIEREFRDDVARGTHMQFLLIRVKQYFRQQRYAEAVVLLRKCIAIATELGYERDKALMVHGLNELVLKVEQQKSEILNEEKSKCQFGSSSEDKSHLESFDSASDSVGVFDSELGDSC